MLSKGTDKWGDHMLEKLKNDERLQTYVLTAIVLLVLGFVASKFDIDID